MDDLKIQRINELYKKSKTIGLSKEEQEEQLKLRQEYLQTIKKNFKNTLKSIKIKDENGNIRSLKKK